LFSSLLFSQLLMGVSTVASLVTLPLVPLGEEICPDGTDRLGESTVSNMLMIDSTLLLVLVVQYYL
jgi:hypothetical protein